MKDLKPLFDFSQLEEKSPNANGLTGQDIISVSQFDRDMLDYVFARGREMRELVQRVGGTDILKGRVLTALFYEPSTRTSSKMPWWIWSVCRRGSRAGSITIPAAAAWSSGCRSRWRRSTASVD